MKFRDQRGVEYVFDPRLHCGDRKGTTFCIVGPGHYGDHWNGEATWPQTKVKCALCRGDILTSEVHTHRC